MPATSDPGNRRGLPGPGGRRRRAGIAGGLLLLLTACAGTLPGSGPETRPAGVWTISESLPAEAPVDPWRPVAVLVLPTGGIVVAESAQNRLHLLDGKGRPPMRLPRPDRTVVEWTALALAPGLSFLALDGPGRRVHQYDFQGNYLGTAIDLEAFADEQGLGVVDPAGLAVDRSGVAVISDRAGDRLLVFGPGWESLGVWGETGSRPGSWRRPGAVAVGSRAPFLVSDEGNRRVVLVDEFGIALETRGLDEVARGVACLDGGRFAVSLGDRVEVLDRDLELLAALPLEPPGGCGGRPFATSALAGSAGEILAGEGCSGRILKILRSGR